MGEMNKYVLTEIRKAEESNATTMEFPYSKITDVTSLAGLTKLGRLFLYGNQITDATPLASLTELHQLDLTNNQITDVTPLANLIKLTELDLAGNPIPEEQIEMLKKALPDCKIEF